MSAAKQLVLGGWVQPNPDEPEDQFREEREALVELLKLANSDLARIEHRVALILQRFPETRDNGVTLALAYWNYWNARTLANWGGDDLEILRHLDNFETIGRSRRHIQNDLKLFPANDFVVGLRTGKQREFLQHVLERKKEEPEIRFYLDETGNNSNDTFTGVGGVCVIDWRFFKVRHAAIRAARQELGPETLHCGNLPNTEEALKPHLALLSALQRNCSGLLFVGHTTRSRLSKREVLCSLFVQLVVDALKRLDEHGCLLIPRVMTLYKEADPGFDSMMGEELQLALQHAVGRAFGDRVYVNPVEPVPKGREVMLECADQIAWALFRRATSPGKYVKDRLAESVMSVTGLEDRNDLGAVFRYHG